MDLNLLQKRALVCGSSQGIGLAVAQELALLGADCILMARNAERLQQALHTLDTKSGQQHHFFVADFSQPDDVRLATEKIIQEGPVHILINNTGGPPAGSLLQASGADFIAALQQHIVNNQQLVQLVLPGMRQATYGRIINIISTSVKQPLPNLGVSNTVRSAVAGWAKSLANEIGAGNVTVNNVLPGLTQTGRLDSLLKHTAAAQQKNIELVSADMQQTVPLKRFAQPAEVAAVVAFLATPAASYINGAFIPVDGGRTGAF